MLSDVPTILHIDKKIESASDTGIASGLESGTAFQTDLQISGTQLQIAACSCHYS
jgi:hypothetical protein